jgi:hypothetical protein
MRKLQLLSKRDLKIPKNVLMKDLHKAKVVITRACDWRLLSRADSFKPKLDWSVIFEHTRLRCTCTGLQLLSSWHRDGRLLLLLLLLLLTKNICVFQLHDQDKNDSMTSLANRWLIYSVHLTWLLEVFVCVCVWQQHYGGKQRTPKAYSKLSTNEMVWTPCANADWWISITCSTF